MPNFNLTFGINPPELAGVYRFKFGTGQSIFVYGDDFARFGDTSIVSTGLGIFAEGIPPLDITAPIISFTELELTLNLVAPVSPLDIDGEYRFKWTNVQSIAAFSIGDLTQFGTAYLVNKALTIAPEGIGNNWDFNSPIIAYKVGNSVIPNKNGLPFNFNLIQGAPVRASVNFSFDGFISIGPGGFDSLQFGSNSIQSLVSYANIDGFDVVQFGDHDILNLSNLVLVTGIAPFSVPSHNIRNNANVVTPGGFNTLTIGTHTIQYAEGDSNSYNFMMLLF